MEYLGWFFGEDMKPEKNTHTDKFISEASFEAIIEHWSKSRIDSAVSAIARYDEAAKQLITLGGILQGVYFAVFAFGKLNENLSVLWSLPLFIPVVLVIFCAAQCVCRFHLRMEAMSAYNLMLRGRKEGLDIDELSNAMDNWCQHIDSVAEGKRRWLHAANSLFVLAMVFAFIALIVLLQSTWNVR